jgi:N-acetylgalactosamine-N,N'-diacetylbacillosaminyl-diphospho-undecaprenol 4-alpha-N-acetylgalactosaminyltransferase
MNAIRDQRSFQAAAPRRRVLFVINSLAGGGAERVMATLLNNSKDWLDAHEIALAVLDEGPRAFALPDWLTIFQLDCRGGLAASITGLRRVVRDYRPDVTISFLTRANLANGVVMMNRRRPWIISERTSTPAHLGSRSKQLATKLMMRAIYPRASRVIAVSAGVADKLEHGFGVPPGKVEVLPNPVDIDALHASASARDELQLDEPYIVAVGRMVSVKNYRMLIHAFAQAKLPCRLVIAGDGPERDALKSLAGDLGIAERVVMPGWLSNPYPVLSRASVFALSSKVEGFPNALVEALALGVPVVATNCHDGPAEILARRRVDEVAGVTVVDAGILTPVDDAASYAQALQLAFEESRRKHMIAAGRERALDYSAAAITQRYWSVIERALERTVGLATS